MPDKMTAVVKTEPKKGAVLMERPVPRPKPDEVLVKVKATSICGTDVHIYTWDAWSQKRIDGRLPQILGHEFAGEIVELGANVRGFEIGDLISAETHIPCGHCVQCLSGQMHICNDLKILGVDIDGCFAQYAAIPAVVAWKNDKTIPPEYACVQEPLGNAVYTTLVEPVTGKSVLIFGDGPTALFAAGVAHVGGASRVILAGMETARLEIARKMGADETINVLNQDTVKVILDETHGVGVDVVLEMAGAQQAVEQAFKCVRKGGRVSAFGIPPGTVTLDWNDAIIFRGVTVYGINGRKMFETWFTVRNLLASKRLDISPVVTHKLPLKDFMQGFDLMLTSPKSSGKVVLLPER